MAKSSKDKIFVLDVWERKVGEEFREDDSVLADLGKWRAQIRQEFDDLFHLP